MCKKQKLYFRNTMPMGDIDINSLWQSDPDNIDMFVLVDDDDHRVLGKSWKHLMRSVSCPEEK